MLEYYNQYRIIPVNQLVVTENYNLFKMRRVNLYSNLGIPLSLVTGKSVIEFGPGTGDNASVIFFFKPSKLDLVDGNTASINRLNTRFGTELGKNIVNIYKFDAKSFTPNMSSQTTEGGMI